MIYYYLRYISDSWSQMISGNMSDRGHLGLFERLISEILFSYYAVPVQLIGLKAFEGYLQTPIWLIIGIALKSSNSNC